MTASARETIDVLICCHNDAELLPNALEALTAQTAPRDSFRLILVDNASTDDPRSVLERYRDRLTIEYASEPELGLNRARNAGYRRATAAYVAHLDADTIPDIGWVQAILDAISQSGCDLCGGPYRPSYTREKPEWFQDRFFIGCDYGATPHELQGREHPHGMNMVWKRSTVERLGGFQTELGLHGRGLERGDETELVRRGRASVENFKVYYHPGISVQTAVRPEMFAFRYWIRRMFVHGRTCRAMWGDIGPGLRWSWPLRGAAALSLGSVALLRTPFRNRRRYPAAKTFLYDHLLQPVFHAGSAYQDAVDLVTRDRN